MDQPKFKFGDKLDTVTTSHESVTWFELQWMFFQHVETDLNNIKKTMMSLLDKEDRSVQFRFQKRVSSKNAYERAVREQHRIREN